MKIQRKQTRLVFGFVMGICLLCGMGRMALACEAMTDAAVTASSQDVVISTRIGELLFGKKADKPAADTQKSDVRMLCPGGEIFGIRLRLSEVIISEIGSERAKHAGLAVGDRIVDIDGMPITSTDDLSRALDTCRGVLDITVERGGTRKTVTVTPEGSPGSYVLGITVRDGTAGIGTVTYIDPANGCFGGLGHGICDAETGEILPMREGVVTEVTLGGVKRGEVGKPGELHGVLKGNLYGVLYKNCAVGVFGKLNATPDKLPIPIATRDEVHEGRATILSTVHGGESCAYEVTISDIDYQSDGTKSFTVKVTDQALIAMTGGIVRGMSGSPIIQDGKLVGAVTHVMVADPTEGYGIFIENMLNASNARNELPKAS